MMDESYIGRGVHCTKRNGSKVEGKICKRKDQIGIKTPYRFYPASELGQVFRAFELHPRTA